MTDEKVINVDLDKGLLEAFLGIKDICRRFVDESDAGDDLKQAWHDKIDMAKFDSAENLVNDILIEFGRDVKKPEELINDISQ